MRLVPRKWEQFQHYKDRSPPWIKLHKDLLNDRVFLRLPDASRALAPCLWLLASEQQGGEFDGSPEEIAFRVRQSEEWVRDALNPLIEAGFFLVCKQRASKPKASSQQPATPETEERREETEEKPRKRGEVSGFPPGFAAFWSLYPRRENKAKAAQAFARIRPDEAQLAAILAGLRRQIASDQWRRDGGQFIPHPTTWLNGRRWEDEAVPTVAGNDPFAGAA